MKTLAFLVPLLALGSWVEASQLAHYYRDNEQKYLGEKVTISIEEGLSSIAQDSDNPIDTDKTFFQCHTVDRETHKSGGTIYVCFPNEEAKQAEDQFNKFPERTRSITGILKKTPKSGNLYLDCRLAGQGSESAGSASTIADTTKEDSASQLGAEIKTAAIAATVVIRTGDGGGSGFLMEEDGRMFVVTNQHVLLGCLPDKLEITTTDGRKLVPKSLQIVPDVDLARVEVSDGPPPLAFASSATMDEPVATVGNSLDAGVITINPGKIKGIGAGEIEVDCEVVPGQSGGPLINSEGAVLGATTYILFANENATSEGTRYANKRYFVVRIGPETAWEPVANWQDYARVGAVLREAEAVFEEAFDIAISADSGPRSDYAYNGANAKLQEAARNHNRFVQKMDQMRGAVVTSMQLDRNNASLGASFRAVYKSIIEACQNQKTIVERELNTGRAKRYPWLHKRCEESAKMLDTLQRFLEGRSKARPKFLTW